jgi:hypothetical protein
MNRALSVTSRGDLIIITHPGTEFSATYGAGNGKPGILLLSATTDQQAEPETIYQFRADAVHSRHIEGARGWGGSCRASAQRPLFLLVAWGVDCSSSLASGNR